jgi:RNA polymerase-binding protein DksA
MNKRDLKKFEKILRMMRDEVQAEVSQISRENLRRNLRAESGDLSGYSTHMADMAGEEAELAMNLRMLATEEDILSELEEALQRIDEGKYGECQVCGGSIGKARLMAKPFASMCIDCRQRQEMGR